MSVVVTGTLATTSPLDVYATHDSFIGLGGAREAATIAIRNAIPVERRTFGMLVTVNADGSPGNNKTYQLQNVALGGVNNTLSDNANWIDFLAGSAGIGGGGTLNYIPKFTPNGTTVGNSLAFDNGTNIGIATVLPTARLHIFGSTSDNTAYSFKAANLAGALSLWALNDSTAGATSSFAVGGAFATTPGNLFFTAGTFNNFAVGNTSLKPLGNPTPLTITGMIPSFDGQRVILFNYALSTVSFTHQDAGSSAANRFYNRTGATVTITNGQTIEYVWFSAGSAVGWYQI